MLLDGDRGELGTYLREMADLMGLCSWTIILMDGNPEDDNHAACAQWIYGRQYLNVFFRDGWEDGKPETFRNTVCHELLHAHLNPLAFGILNPLAELIGKTVYEHAWAAMEAQLEFAVDRIATVWAESLPLPIKAKPEREMA